MSGPSVTARVLFWTFVTGGALSLVYGRTAAVATGVAMAATALHRLDRPRRFRRLVRRTARAHARVLALRRRQECFVDAYGNAIDDGWLRERAYFVEAAPEAARLDPRHDGALDDGWLRERAYFVERTVVPRVEARGLGGCLDARWDEAVAIVEAVARSVELPPEADAPEDGIAYERYCAGLLERAGWRAGTTRASGDQGADVVAERDGLRLVVQCKRHGRPVGNGAVQEAAAAARHWSADLAAVVSNAGFTPAARKLAASTGVRLLHHDDLADLDPGPPLRAGKASRLRSLERLP